MFLLAMIDLTSILPFAVFGGVAFGTWVLFDLVSTPVTSAEKRLERFRRDCRAGDSIQASQAMSIGRLWEKAGPTFARAIKPQKEQDITRVKGRLSLAGYRGEKALTRFLAIKVGSALLGLLLGAALLVVGWNFQWLVIIQCLGMGGVFLFIPDFLLGFLISARQKKIFLALPDALDLLVVCVESGLGLDQALRQVAEEMEKTHRVISAEFDICNKQLQMGRERDEVLNELGTRNGVADLKALASIMIQADRFGSSIAQALRVQSDSMRTRRRQLAEEKAAKTAVKLIFPLVLFIFPGIFVVLVGPAAITMINEMLPALQR